MKISADSRVITQGDIFVAIKGNEIDGHDYIVKAIANGAKTIIHQDPLNEIPGITYIKVDNSRLALSEFAAKIYPKQPKYILGVTGTSGKSSVVHFVRKLLQLLGKKAVSIGTLGVLGDLAIASDLTTPSTEDLHRILQQIAENNIDYAAIECSSHGIEQHRLTNVNFSACAFTNLSQDHLDYHHNMAQYFAAKKQLFEFIKPAVAVLNSDIPEFAELRKTCAKHRLICYGKSADADIQISSITPTNNGQIVEWRIDGTNYQSKINLVGEFQIYNLACAIGLLMSVDIKHQQIIPLLEKIETVTGRMELVATHNNANIFVDYAHKPDALLNVLKTLKVSTANNLSVVFGCGGNRDKEKRKIMGKIACDIADQVIVTDDNPRTEDPLSIRAEILKGCGRKAIEIADREQAIIYAMKQLMPGDNLIIAGKGHENYQIIGKNKIYFSDAEIVRNLLNDLLLS